MDLQSSIDTLVIGAGPYGLSLSSHLRAAGVEHRVLGDPMSSWSAMPKGMCLRSPASASSLSDPAGELTIEAFHERQGTPLLAPVPRDAFIDYGHWFLRQAAIEVERRFVAGLATRDGSFVATLEDGETIRAERVVLAAGTPQFRWVPPEFADLPTSLVSHAGDHTDLGIFAGRELVVMGAGQSGIECAALAHEAGASVRVVMRAPGVHWLTRSAWLHSAPVLSKVLYSPTDVGPAGLSRVVSAPGLFRQLPDELRAKASRRCSRPAAGAWLIERTKDVPFETGHAIRSVSVHADRVRIEREGADALECDHLLLATGYKVDLARYSFLAPELLAGITTVNGYPVLRRGFVSSLPGLHILGWPAIWAYGPLNRHVSGVSFASRSVTQALSARRSTAGVRRRPRQYHFSAASYVSEVTANVPHYRELQAAIADATRGTSARSILDLGSGTGETAAAVLGVHPGARVTAIDASSQMLAVARSRLPSENLAELVVGKLEDPLPSGEFDLVVSSLAVHHLSSRQKRELFARVHGALAPGSCFVLGDVVRPERPEDALTPTSRIHDRPERAEDLERWLTDCGFDVARAWSAADLVVFRAVPQTANGGGQHD
ncbi:MAG: methyltransferase domain-containing protein [Solirubrobacteraceae bacterium]|jgi:SAM-dependent methyltransferase/thioredoxin reductase